MCLFLLAGVIFCAEMMRAYKDEAGATVASYWRRLDPTDMSSKDDALDGYDEARTAKIARRWFLAANGILAAAAVFLSLSLLVSGSLMGLKYTVKRVGSGVNFAGCIFGFFLLALCAIVARTTYRVPDAVSLDVEVDFPYGDHRQSDAMLEFDRTLHETPWKIFQDDPPPRPHGLDPTTPPAPSPLPSSNETALSTPPPPPPPSPPWNAAFPARAMWINHEQHSRRRVHGEINPTVVHFTVSFAGVNASADVDLNATLPPVVKARVEEFARNESSVVVKNIRPGAKHGIGGAWTAHLLAAVGAVTVISSAAGFIGVTGGSIGALLVHLFFCAVTFVMAVVGAHLVTDHADDTKAYIGDHWREIQTGLVGEDVAAEDAGAFASQHMRAAAALGAITCVILGVSAGCSFTALLAINGAFDRGARRGAYRGVSRGAPRHRELVDEESESDEYDDDGWGDDGWGDGWGDASRDDDDGEVLVAEKRANRRVRTSTRGGGGVRRDASAAKRRAENGSGASPSGSGSRVGDAVLEMTDLAKMVGEARGGRGRFKSRGGKSSRTLPPSPRWSAARRGRALRSAKRDWRGRRRRRRKPRRRGWTKASSPFSVASPAASRRRTVSVEVSPPRPTGGVGESGTSVFRDEIADRDTRARRWRLPFRCFGRRRRGGTLTIRRRRCARRWRWRARETRHSYARRSGKTSPSRGPGETQSSHSSDGRGGDGVKSVDGRTRSASEGVHGTIFTRVASRRCLRRRTKCVLSGRGDHGAISAAPPSSSLFERCWAASPPVAK